MADRHVRELANRIASLEKAVQAQNLPQLGHSSIEDGGISEYDGAGVLSSRVGKQYDLTHAPVTFAGPIPPAPAGVGVIGGPLSATATWDGTFTDDSMAPLDFMRTEVHRSNSGEDFTPDPLPASTTRVGSIESAGGASLTFAADPGTYWVKFVTRAQSGKFSAPSDPIQVSIGSLNVPMNITAGGSISTSGGDSGGTFEVNADHLKYQSVGTQNLCTTPKLDTIPASVTKVGCTLSNEGAPIWDGVNVDYMGVYQSRKALKIVATAARSTATLSCGAIEAGKTYTVSVHTAAGMADGSNIGFDGVYGRLSDFTVGSYNADSGLFAFGAFGAPDGFYLTDTTPGHWDWDDYVASYPSGYGSSAIAHWSYRIYRTFTTPDDLPAGTECTITLPGPSNLDGTADTVHALFAGGVQLEEKPYVTRYCDGDQAACLWDGTPNASTSTRTGFSGLFLPSWGDPLFQSNLNVGYTNSKKIKRGSGSPQGTNQVQVYQPSQWTLADKVHYTPTFSAEGPRKSQDDGIIWDGQKTFYATVQGVWYYAFMFHLSGLPVGNYIKSVQVRLYRNGSDVADAVFYAIPDSYDGFFARLSGTVLANAGDAFSFDVRWSNTQQAAVPIDPNSTTFPNTVSWGLIC